MRDPHNRVRFSVSRTTAETYTFVVEVSGKHEFCFNNDFSTVSPKSITFDVISEEDKAAATSQPQSGEDKGGCSMH